jgi:hypothetical protein
VIVANLLEIISEGASARFVLKGRLTQPTPATSGTYAGADAPPGYSHSFAVGTRGG